MKTNVLTSILSLIQNPEMVAKNIEALNAKLQATEDAVRLAREEQAKAAQLTSQIKDAQKELDALKAEHDAREAELKAQANKLTESKAQLDAVATDLLDKQMAHGVASRALEARETQVRVAESAINEQATKQAAEHAKRQSELDALTKSLQEREELVLTRENELKTKVEKLKQLAG